MSDNIIDIEVLQRIAARVECDSEMTDKDTLDMTLVWEAFEIALNEGPDAGKEYLTEHRYKFKEFDSCWYPTQKRVYIGGHKHSLGIGVEVSRLFLGKARVAGVPTCGNPLCINPLHSRENETVVVATKWKDLSFRDQMEVAKNLIELGTYFDEQTNCRIIKDFSKDAYLNPDAKGVPAMPWIKWAKFQAEGVDFLPSIPIENYVCKCGNRRCVNPDHWMTLI